MSKNFCDATGEEIAVDAQVTGPYGRQYADCIRPLAERYLSELNDLRRSYRRVLSQLPDDPPQ